LLVSRQSVLWIVIGTAASLAAFVLSTIPLRQQGNANSASSSATITSPPVTREIPDDRQNDDLVQIPAVSPKQAELQKQELLPPTPPPLDKTVIEMRRKMAAGFNAELREQTRRLYGVAFQQLGLPANLQEKVIDILTKQQQQLEQQAFEAAQSGNIPAPPSLEEIRTQQAQQDNQLRSVLGMRGSVSSTGIKQQFLTAL
jgi:hypothetical protein